MVKGKVKWFHRKKGYGFIITAKGDEAFVHYTDIAGDGFKYLDDGEDVECEIEKGEKGFKARKVERDKIQALKM